MAPTPPEAQASDAHRSDIEPSRKLMTGELSREKGQFKGQPAEPRVARGVAGVATVLWLLFARRQVAQSEELNGPKWWRGRRLTPGAVRRVAVGLFVKLGIRPPQPQVRGKPPGRAGGPRLEPRKR